MYECPNFLTTVLANVFITLLVVSLAIHYYNRKKKPKIGYVDDDTVFIPDETDQFNVDAVKALNKADFKKTSRQTHPRIRQMPYGAVEFLASRNQVVAKNRLLDSMCQDYRLYFLDFNDPENEFKVQPEEQYWIANMTLCEVYQKMGVPVSEDFDVDLGILLSGSDGILIRMSHLMWDISSVIFYKRSHGSYYAAYRIQATDVDPVNGYQRAVLKKCTAIEPPKQMLKVSQQYLINRSIERFVDM